MQITLPANLITFIKNTPVASDLSISRSISVSSYIYTTTNPKYQLSLLAGKFKDNILPTMAYSYTETSSAVNRIAQATDNLPHGIKVLIKALFLEGLALDYAIANEDYKKFLAVGDAQRTINNAEYLIQYFQFKKNRYWQTFIREYQSSLKYNYKAVLPNLKVSQQENSLGKINMFPDSEFNLLNSWEINTPEYVRVDNGSISYFGDADGILTSPKHSVPNSSKMTLQTFTDANVVVKGYDIDGKLLAPFVDQFGNRVNDGVLLDALFKGSTAATFYTPPTCSCITVTYIVKQGATINKPILVMGEVVGTYVPTDYT